MNSQNEKEEQVTAQQLPGKNDIATDGVMIEAASSALKDAVLALKIEGKETKKVHRTSNVKKHG